MLVLHALVLLGLPHGAGPALRDAAVQPLTVRQIVRSAAPPGAAEEEPAPPPARPADAPRAVPSGVRRPASAAGQVPRASSPPKTAVAAAPVQADAPAAGPPVPTYPTRLPPAAVLRYELRRNLAVGTGELTWSHDGTGYALSLVGHLGGQEALGWTSRGHVDAHGLAPERFVVRRRGRELLAANFQREAGAGGRVTFSGPRGELALAPGMQDRVSWLIQLAAIVEATPRLGLEGEPVSMWVVGARGDAEVWTFVAAGRAPVELADGSTVEAVRLLREPRRPYDAQVEVWLDPARSHLPVRAKLLVRPSGESTEFVLATPPPR